MYTSPEAKAAPSRESLLERVKVQERCGRYRVLVDGKPWHTFHCCDLGGGPSPFETGWLLRARIEASRVRADLAERETPWRDVPEVTSLCPK